MHVHQKNMLEQLTWIFSSGERKYWERWRAIIFTLNIQIGQLVFEWDNLSNDTDYKLCGFQIQNEQEFNNQQQIDIPLMY